MLRQLIENMIGDYLEEAAVVTHIENFNENTKLKMDFAVKTVSSILKKNSIKYNVTSEPNHATIISVELRNKNLEEIANLYRDLQKSNLSIDYLNDLGHDGSKISLRLMHEDYQ